MPLALRRGAIATLFLGLAVGCRGPDATSTLQRFEYKEPHMGTLFTITLYAADEAAAQAGSQAAFARVTALDRMMTDYNPASELMQLCQHPPGEAVPVSRELFEVIARAQEISKLSAGAFDITVGPVVRLWRRTRRSGELPLADVLAKAREAVGWQKLHLEAARRTVTLTVPHMQLDLGGIAKGYAADEALAALRQRGITRALVAASGDIRAGAPPPGQPGWRVNIGAPIDAPDRVRAGTSAEAARVGTVWLNDSAVSTSGDTEQFVEIGGRHYSHVVDPRTGIGLTQRLQVTVVGRRATDTDAFGKVVGVSGVAEGLALIERQPGLAAFVVRGGSDGGPPVVSRRWQKLATRGVGGG